MRDVFPGHYRPTDHEFDAMWESGIFAVDAGVLLNLYRYSQATRDKLLDILKGIQDRLWVPFQAALEYQENRLEVIDSSLGMYAAIRTDLKNATTQLTARAMELQRHPVLEPEILLGHVEQFSETVKQYLDKHNKPFDFDGFSSDPIRDELSTLLQGRIGGRFSEEELKHIHAEGARRYAAKIPPGFRDTDKGEPRQYGDLVIWKELLGKARETQKPVIFVTDDAKEDWWWEFKGRKLGPRPELVMEMRQQAGVSFYAYRPDRFMEEASRFLKQAVPTEAIEEAETLGTRAGSDEWLEILTGDEEGFAAPDVCNIVGISYRQLDYWTRTGLVRPSIASAYGSGTQRRYSYSDLVSLTLIKELLDRGMSLQSVRQQLTGFTDSASLVLADYLVTTSSLVFLTKTEDLSSLLQDLEEAADVVPLQPLIARLNRAIGRH